MVKSSKRRAARASYVRGKSRRLLAVDLGVRTGFAIYEDDGGLLSYRSQNFGSAARLKRAIPSILRDIPGLAILVIEGGGPLAQAWDREAERLGVDVRHISADEWRADLLHAREQRSGVQAKRVADAMARRVIVASSAPRPTSLRHDAAEAILIGLWAAVREGWATPPSDMR